MKLNIIRRDWPYRVPFRISYRYQTISEAVIVELIDGSYRGRGEAAPVPYKGDGLAHILADLERVRDDIERGLDRGALALLLPACAARNALDCALWDLGAKRSGIPVWQLAGLSPPRPVRTALTIGLDEPDAMAGKAALASAFPLLKIKVDRNAVRQVEAIRIARPDAELMVDANQAWTFDELLCFEPDLKALGVTLIEQPLAIGEDEALSAYRGSIPLCADESLQDVADLSRLAGLYRLVNIKLDKTGGLSRALELARRAPEFGLRPMMGCMGGSSLAMAPASLVAQLCDLADLDSPCLIAEDIEHPIIYDGPWLSPPTPALWG